MTLTHETTGASRIEQILKLAIWAPSGDNEQPWKFEIPDQFHVVVHCADTRDHCVYDLDGRPSQIAFGALFETMAIAATGYGLDMSVTRRPASPEERPVFDVAFTDNPGIVVDPLISSIETRSVQRRPMKVRPLSASEKSRLEQAVADNYEILWLEGGKAKLEAARLMYNNAKLRLLMPEAYEVHKNIIDWKDDEKSTWGVPAKALGVDPLTLGLMRWAMKSWRRLEVTNAVLGTWAPRLQMDFIPGIACAAHFVIRARRQPTTIDDYVAAGRAVQRFWLTLTQLGLGMQPEMTPLIFSRYVANGTPFTKVARLRARAISLQTQLAGLIGSDGLGVFMGRVGAGPVAGGARSVRKSLTELMKIN